MDFEKKRLAFTIRKTPINGGFSGSTSPCFAFRGGF
jgi:hypothetical protein